MNQDKCLNPDCEYPVLNPYIPFCSTCYFLTEDGEIKKLLNRMATYRRLYGTWPKDFDERVQKSIDSINQTLGKN
ncbi:MAG: hypothetical protein G3M70_07175 [Candidatus Nitronauta litoralis]|uniref:Uncharacterized protein n=1 Tax=Candidatus Nitronauta litoralis TaxID=2705533 RepID=A0A7T0BVG7_9BACT|nr:MAG: hypothetical protein G3M70_07175 [Candidatus Nitronauta litoralis]